MQRQSCYRAFEAIVSQYFQQHQHKGRGKAELGINVY